MTSSVLAPSIPAAHDRRTFRLGASVLTMPPGEHHRRLKNQDPAFRCWDEAPDAAVARPPAAAERRQTSDDHRAVAATLSLTLQTMTDGFCALDRTGRVTSLNAEAERVLCRPAGRLLGRFIWDEFPEAVGSNLHQRFERTLAEGVPVAFVEFYAPLNLWFQVRACCCPEGLLVFFSDVTEGVLAQRKIVQLHADLEERVRVRTAELETLTQDLKTFSLSVAHDLRAPLAAISGFSQLLEKEDGPDVSPRRRHLVGRIRGAAHQMEEMTAGLLALARVSPAPMRVAPVDLGRIATALLEKIREHHPDRHVDVHVMPDLRAEGDEVLLTQALSNLLSNAWKFSGKQPHARIEVGSQAGADGETVYFVKDNGAGFDMNYAARLFGVFSRLHSAAEFEGTGIGLAIVKKVIDRHGGRVWAQSAPDQGAGFYFTLKAQAEQVGGPTGCGLPPG
jgi:signal transduction histidine kinase